MTVYDLTQDEKEELKSNLFWGASEADNLDQQEKKTLDQAKTCADIPDAIIFSAYSGYEFVKDDFFCNTVLP